MFEAARLVENSALKIGSAGPNNRRYSRRELVLKEGRDRCGYVGLSSPPQTPAGSKMFDPSEVKRQSTHHMIDQIGPV